MREYIELGPVPADESCAQVGSDNYQTEARAECQRYRELLEKRFPNAKFGIKSFPHDFGSYYEVVAYYDPSNDAEVNTAYEVEANLPQNWED